MTIHLGALGKLSKRASPGFKVLVLLPLGSKNDPLGLLLKFVPAGVEIRFSSFEDIIISCCPDGPRHKNSNSQCKGKHQHRFNVVHFFLFFILNT